MHPQAVSDALNFVYLTTRAKLANRTWNQNQNLNQSSNLEPGSPQMVERFIPVSHLNQVHFDSTFTMWLVVQLTSLTGYSQIWLFSLHLFRYFFRYTDSIVSFLSSDHPGCIKICAIYPPQVTSMVRHLDWTTAHLFVYLPSLDLRRRRFDIKVAILFIPSTKHSVLSRSTQYTSSKSSTLSRYPPISRQVDDTVTF